MITPGRCGGEGLSSGGLFSFLIACFNSLAREEVNGFREGVRLIGDGRFGVRYVKDRSRLKLRFDDKLRGFGAFGLCIFSWEGVRGFVMNQSSPSLRLISLLFGLSASISL